MATNLCLQPLYWNGDVTQCHLVAGHALDCYLANREARLDVEHSERYGGAV
jgi:protein gp37